MARQEAAMINCIVFSLLALLAFALGIDPPSARAADLDSQAVLRSLEDAFVSVADHVTPSVVNVSVKPKRNPAEGGSSEREEQFREFFGPQFFERFFRQR